MTAITADTMQRRENMTSEKVYSPKTKFAKAAYYEIEELGVLLELEKPLRVVLQNLYIQLLDSNEMIEATKDPGVRLLVKDVFTHKISHAVGTVASLANSHKAITGESISAETAEALAFIVSTQIDLADSTAENDRTKSFQLHLFSYLANSLLKYPQIPEEIPIGFDQHSYKKMMSAVQSGLFENFRRLLTTRQEGLELYSSYMLEKLKTYSDQVALEHVLTPTEKREIISIISKDQSSLTFSNPDSSDFARKEKERLGDPLTYENINSPYFEFLTNGFNFILATYIFFESKNLPHIKVLTGTRDLFTLCNKAAHNLGLFHLFIDDITDLKKEQPHDRNLARGKSKRQIQLELAQSYYEAKNPFKLLNESGENVEIMEGILSNLVDDLTLFFGARAFEQLIQFDTSYQYFDVLLRDDHFKGKLSKVIRRALWYKLTHSLLSD